MAWGARKPAPAPSFPPPHRFQLPEPTHTEGWSRSWGRRHLAGEAPPTKWEGVGLEHLKEVLLSSHIPTDLREWRLPALFLDVRGRKVSASNSIVSESL